MLSAEDNEILTRVGPGTPMGNLYRRYWIPACLSKEVDEPDGPPVRVRLLGEDLVMFRDTTGQLGLIEEQCPHRGASLFYGRNEECGLRCTYHGWKFDVTGQCVDQRSELHPFAHRIKITSYPTHESGGIVWTYLGPPETMTPFRDFGTESLPADQAHVIRESVYCNWVQSMDGDLDTAHISNLHQFDAIDDVPDDGSDKPGYPSGYMSMRFWRHDPRSEIEVDDTWHGFRYAGIRTTPNGHKHARITAWIFPACSIIAAIPFSTRQIFVVPVDDTTTYRYSYTTQPPQNPRGLGGPPFFTYEKYPFEMMQTGTGDMPRKYTRENDYGIDRVAQKGISYSGIPDFRSQDNMSTETAGPIYDRTREHLGSTDVAVIRMHRLLLRAAKAVMQGEQPPALAGAGDFRAIRGAEKILEAGEDWRVLGTDDDPIVQEALAADQRLRTITRDPGEPTMAGSPGFHGYGVISRAVGEASDARSPALATLSMRESTQRYGIRDAGACFTDVRSLFLPSQTKEARVSIRTFVAEPAAVTREGLLAILGRVRDIEVVAAIRRGEEVVTAVRSTVPDVLLIAARFPACDGIALVSPVLSAVPDCSCAVLSSGWRAGDLRRAAEAGVRGFLAADSPADSHPEFLTTAVRKLAAGGKVVDPSLPDVGQAPPSFALTTREADVLHVAAQGATTAEIARILCLSEGTVRNYLSRAITKTGARNRVDAIRIANESGWLLPP